MTGRLFESLRLVFLLLILLIPSILYSIVKNFIPKRKKNVSGQLALITGGSEGIGKAVAMELAQNGCRIAIANRNIEKGRKTAEEIRQKYNVKAEAFKCDVGNCKDVKMLKKNVNESLGTVDILVNNAGLMPLEHSLLEGQDQPYQYCIDVNLTSWLWTTRAFLPDMIKQKRGHIIGVSSLSVKCPIQNMVTYVTTKHGNTGFMDGLQQEMAFYDFDGFIKTSTVYTGFVKTNDEMFKMISTYFLEKLLFFCEADQVGKKIVDGILKNCEVIYASVAENILVNVMNSLPSNIKKIFMRGMLKKDMREIYINKRLRDFNL